MAEIIPVIKINKKTTFHSDEEVREFRRSYEANFYPLAIKVPSNYDGKKNPILNDELTRSGLDLICRKGGTYIPTGKKNKRGTIKCDCKFMVRLKLSKTGENKGKCLEVEELFIHHNHDDVYVSYHLIIFSNQAELLVTDYCNSVVLL